MRRRLGRGRRWGGDEWWREKMRDATLGYQTKYLCTANSALLGLASSILTVCVLLTSD